MRPQQPPESGWQYNAADSDPVSNGQANDRPKSTQSVATAPDMVTWTASEYISHHKTGAWYFGLIVAAAALCIAVYFSTHDIFSVVIIAIALVILGSYAARKPRTLRYTIDEFGVRIGDKLYVYEEFRSFAVMQDGAVSCIALTPLKRFMPLISLYFPPQEEDRIIMVLSNFLPFEPRKYDAIERFMKRIRF